MRVAIVGTGIAGMGAAWALHRDHEIVVYEKESRIGGHSHTVDIDYDGTPIAVDIGFIVYNETNYPNLTALFAHLDVPTTPTEMTFGFSAQSGRLEYQGNNVRSLFAQRSNAFRPSFHRMWMDILRFRRESLTDLESGRADGHTLGSYLAANAYSAAFRDNCVAPMGAAIWSSSARSMLDFPAQSFIRFFDNHRLFHFEKPSWRTVSGGSKEYVLRLIAPFESCVRTKTAVARIERNAAGVDVVDERGRRERFDHVILACHSDQALGLLADPTRAERDVLGALRYAPNAVYLHRDPALMPRRKSVWSSWNYLAGAPEDQVSITYWMNALQHIDRRRPLFVSLNPHRPPAKHLTFATFTCDHPQFDGAVLAAQRRLPMIQGLNHTSFCGAYAGYGFHEDGLKASLEVAERLGANLPWGRVAAGRHPAEFRQAAE